jgi:hypothetical protein
MLLSPSFNGIFHKNANGFVTLEKFLIQAHVFVKIPLNEGESSMDVANFSSIPKERN